MSTPILSDFAGLREPERRGAVIQEQNQRIRRIAAVIALISVSYYLGCRVGARQVRVQVEYIAPAVAAPGPDYYQPADQCPLLQQS